MNKKMQTMTQENTDKNLYAPFLFMSLWTDMNGWQEVQATKKWRKRQFGKSVTSLRGLIQKINKTL